MQFWIFRVKFECSGIYPTEDLSVNNYPAILGSEFSERKIVFPSLSKWLFYVYDIFHQMKILFHEISGDRSMESGWETTKDMKKSITEFLLALLLTCDIFFKTEILFYKNLRAELWEYVETCDRKYGRWTRRRKLKFLVKFVKVWDWKEFNYGDFFSFLIRPVNFSRIVCVL